MRPSPVSVVLLVATTLALIAGCGGSGSPAIAPQDTQTGGDGAAGTDIPTGADLSGGDTSGPRPDGGGQCPAGAPEGHATIRFQVDDRARRTFQDGEMVWTGSFALDRDSNVVTYSAAWLPTDGPYPLLYDDGPRSACGHEVPDALAGDHIFSSEVYFLAEEETVIEYGLLNEWNNWMWAGANGVLTIPASSEQVFDAGGMVIPPCGLADLRITLDLNALHESFAGSITPGVGETPASHDLYVKGSMNQWTDVLLVDNGRRGDELAGDGVYTFQLSQNLGKHDCRLLAGEHAQFVFSFAFPEQEPALEYKALVEGSETALPDGVSAWVDPLGDGSWQEAEVFAETASDGRKKNTTVAVPGSAPTCAVDGDCTAPAAHCIVGYCVECYDDAHCGVGGACVANYCEGGGSQPECGRDEDCEGLTVCVAERCVECRDATSCAEGEQCLNYRCAPLGTGCASDGDCDEGVCVQTVCVDCRLDGDCPEGERCSANRCVPRQGTGEGPIIYQVLPSSGSIGGGTAVTVKGLRFPDPTEVFFGEAAATVVVVSSATELSCLSPAGLVGRSHVSVRDPATGEGDTFYGGYYYFDQDDGPAITSLTPATGSMAGATAVDIWGSNFDPGVQVRFGANVAAVTFVDGGHLAATTPPGAAGAVDVSAMNPSGLGTTCARCFTYQPEVVDWAGLREPFVVRAFAGSSTPALFASVYEGGVTPGEGAGLGMTAQVGYGPDGSDPQAGGSPWLWRPAAYHGDLANEWGDLNNDIYTGSLTVEEPGLYDFAFRFSVDGGESWTYADRDFAALPYDPGAAGGLQVDALPSGPVITSLQPAVGSVLGATRVAIEGINFAQGLTVTFGGVEAPVESVTATRVVVTTPTHAPGRVDVVVSNPDDERDTLEDGFFFGLVHSPVMDGQVLGDWPEEMRTSTNEVATDWGVENRLQHLFLAFDETHLYVGVVGKVDDDNAIVGYVDPALSEGPGLSGSDGCWDDGGLSPFGDVDLDDALCVTESEENAFAFAVEGFAPTVAFGIRDGAYYDDPGCTRLGDANMAGWRRVAGIADPANLSWLCGQVLRQDREDGLDQFELSIPLEVLFAGAAYPEGTRVGLVVRLVNQHGDYSANQALPPLSGAEPGEGRYRVEAISSIQIR